MFKYTVKVNKGAFNRAIKDIENRASKTCVEAVKETAEKGAEFANEQYAKAFYEGVHDAVATAVQVNQYAYRIVATGNSVPFIEWGYGKGRPDVSRTNPKMREVGGKPIWWFKGSGDVQDAIPAWSYMRPERTRYYYITRNNKKRYVSANEVLFDGSNRPYMATSNNAEAITLEGERQSRQENRMLMVESVPEEEVERPGVYVASGAKPFHVMAHTRAYVEEIFPKIAEKHLSKLK